MLDMLYKRTSTGAMQTWEIEVCSATGRYRTISGQIDGKKVVSEWTQAKPKNAGRANATTPQEQAMAEARAAWEKKLRDGYSETIVDAAGSERFQCMLAQDYVNYTDDKKSRKPRVLAALISKKPIYSQPKLDGIRLIASRGSMLSRKGRDIVAVPHVYQALQALFLLHPKLIVDGELYEHSLRDDFDSLVSLVRKGKPSSEDFEKASVLKYHVYDAAGSFAGDCFSTRYSKIKALVEELGSPHIVAVPTKRVLNESEIDNQYNGYLEDGYEGQMLRFDTPYEQKRSDKLIKRKEHEDKEFTCLSIEEGEGNRTGQAGFVILSLDGQAGTFKAGIRAPLDKRLELLEHAERYARGDVTVRFNGRTPKGVPRFPRAIAFYPGGRDV